MRRALASSCLAQLAAAIVATAGLAGCEGTISVPGDSPGGATPTQSTASLDGWSGVSSSDSGVESPRADAISADLSASLDAGAVSDSSTPPLRDDLTAARSWSDRLETLANRTRLAAAFKAARYVPPSGTYLLAARVLPGVKQPAFSYFSLGTTGFAFSRGRYWPASTVKLTAALGALHTLARYKLSGGATVSFSDDDGSYSGTVSALYRKAIVASNNVAYNRLMEIAGFDELNDRFLTPPRGFARMVLQRRYTKPLPTSNLRRSPRIRYAEGSRKGEIAPRLGTGKHASCPNEANCITLAELLDVMRRVTLDKELPAAHRFAIGRSDLAGLKKALHDAPTRLEPGASRALGHSVTVYNKRGEVWGNDRLDHGLIVDKVSGARYLIALSMPYNATSDAAASELTRHALAAIKTVRREPPLQLDAGVSIRVRVDRAKPASASGGVRYRFTIDAAGATSAELWLGRTRVTTTKRDGAGRLVAEASVSKTTAQDVIVRALASTKLIGYRAARWTPR